jgi:hypothetical protein
MWAPEQSHLARDIGILDRGSTDAEDHDMRVAERSGRVEQIGGTGDRDDAQIGRTILEPTP